MPAKHIALDATTQVRIFKRKGVRSIRLSIVGDGSIRVTQPRWLPYKAGIAFTQSRKEWIKKHAKPPQLLRNHQSVGKSFTLIFKNDDTRSKPSSRVSKTSVVVKLPQAVASDSREAQSTALKAVERALKKDAESFIIPRVHELAGKHGFTFKSIAIKKLRSRWGSCSSHKDIIFSSYLVQLPWECIDYVILHELQHTEILAHGKDFWTALGMHVNDLPQLRKRMKQFSARAM